jgi:hypothetical protein
MRVEKCDDAIVRRGREQEISDNALGAENRCARRARSIHGELSVMRQLCCEQHTLISVDSQCDLECTDGNIG